MKKITIIIQRSELNYLINYNSVRISSDRIINFSYSEFNSLSEKAKVSLLESSLPIFEQEHEVLLMEYDSMFVSYDNGSLIDFNGIISIIPLTEMGSRLLSAKLNTDFNILDPLDSNLYKTFSNNRNHLLRIRASQKLNSLYNLDLPDEEFIADFKRATLFQINDTIPSTIDSTLAHLISFNVTPSFIPEGNIEALIKSACVGMKKLGYEVDQVKVSTFYNFVMEEKEVINNKSLLQSIQYLEVKTDLDKNERVRFNKLKETLSEKGKYENAFLLFSYFYSLKKQIEKNNYDVSAPKEDILELKHFNADLASKVLFMLGYTFSIQTISKSIQSFSNSPLLKTHKNIDLEWTPIAIEEAVIENDPIETDNIEYELDVDQGQNENSFEDEKPTEVELTVSNSPLTKTHKDKDLESFPIANEEPKTEKDVTEADNIESESDATQGQSDNSFENDKAVVEESIIKKDEKKNLSLVQPTAVNKLEASGNSADLFSQTIEPKTDSEKEEVNYGFTYEKFEENLKKRKQFLPKILNVLKATEIPENKITKEILINCLTEIDEYEKQNGGIKVAAKDALKIFE